jgi:hypothetical protein
MTLLCEQRLFLFTPTLLLLATLAIIWSQSPEVESPFKKLIHF